MGFEELLKKVSPTLKAITKKLDGRYTAFDEDDLYQEAVVYLWDKNNHHEFDDKTESFILQGCYFFLKNYIRKTHRKLDRTCISINACRNDGSANENDFTQTLADRRNHYADIHEYLLRADIERFLDRREKRIFTLKLRGLTTRQIGTDVGISHVMVTKIEKQIRRKCRRIKKELSMN